MSERQAQARAEAERYMHRVMPFDTIGDHYSAIAAFVDGALWADAHPQPRTITHDDMGAAYAAFMEAEGHQVRRLIVALKAIGFEVRDE